MKELTRKKAFKIIIRALKNSATAISMRGKLLYANQINKKEFIEYLRNCNHFWRNNLTVIVMNKNRLMAEITPPIYTN